MISVIIPLYNKEKTILSTLNSIRNQTLRNWECIVVDDGSSDNSCKIIEELHDERIRLIKKENGGPSSARNFGLQYAKGEWIIYMDADDVFFENAFDIFEDLIKSHSSIKCFCANFKLLVGKRHRLYSRNTIDGLVDNPFKRFLFQEISPRAGTLMLHKSIAGKYKFPEQMRRNEDVKYIFDVLKNEKVFSSSRYVMLYNQNTLAASGRLNDIKKDYLGYLPHYSTDKWESVAYYNLYKQAYRNYLNEANNLYPGNVFATPSTKLRSRILYVILLIRRIIDKFLFTIHL